MNLFIGPILLILLVVIELCVVRLIKKENIPWPEIVMNLNSGHILLWLFRGVQLIVYNYVAVNFSLELLESWPLSLQILFAFFAWDFLWYWLHRAHHELKFLWAIHEVHHQGEHFNLSLGIRNSWFSSLSSLPFFLPLAFLGISVEIFLLVSSIHYFVQFYNHTRIVKNSGWLEYFMITPASHKVHHGKNPEYIDKNCGGTFNFWDKIFGTFQTELEGVPIELGIHQKVVSDNPFWINTIPFLKAFGLKSKAKPQHSKTQFVLDDFLISVGGFLLFPLLLVYIYYENDWNVIQRLFLFLGIFISTIGLGGLYQRKIWGIIIWLLFSFVLNWMFLGYFKLFTPLVIFLFSLHSLHGVFVFVSIIRNRE